MNAQNRLLHVVSAALGGLALLFAASASAYVGPGLATGVFGSVLGILGGLLMLAVGAVWYPLKKLLRSRGPRGGSNDLR